MFSRAFICPRCGETGGLQLEAPLFQPGPYGVRIAVVCDWCYPAVRVATLDPSLAHRFLRRSLTGIRVGHCFYRPSLWQPVSDGCSLSYYRSGALVRQVVDVLGGWLGGFKPSELILESGARLECELMIQFLLDTAVAPRYESYLSLDFYLSWLSDFHNNPRLGQPLAS